MMTTTSTDPFGNHSARVGSLGTAARLTVVELRLFLREPGVLVGLVGFPAVTVLVLAGVFGTSPDPDFAGVRPSEHYVVGYIGVVLAYVGLVALPVHVASRRELGVVRRYRASGVSARAMLASDAAVGAVLAIVASVVVFVAGWLVYGVGAPVDALAVVAWYGAGLISFVALGIALGTLMPSSRTASAVGNLLFVPMFLLGGGGPPREVMTGPMQTISDALPLSHVIGGLRVSWLGATDDPQAIWWTLLLTAVAGALALWVARRRVS